MKPAKIFFISSLVSVGIVCLTWSVISLKQNTLLKEIKNAVNLQEDSAKQLSKDELLQSSVLSDFDAQALLDAKAFISTCLTEASEGKLGTEESTTEIVSEIRSLLADGAELVPEEYSVFALGSSGEYDYVALVTCVINGVTAPHIMIVFSEPNSNGFREFHVDSLVT